MVRFAKFVGLYQHEQDKAAVSLLLNWFRQLAEHGRVPPEEYAQLDYVYRSEEEVRTMLVATLKQERKNIYAKGEADGFIKGEAAGIIKGEAAGLAAGMQVQRQTILQLLQFRFNLADTEQQHIAKELEQIQALEQLRRLTNSLLSPTSRLEDFIAQLTSYLSPNPAS